MVRPRDHPGGAVRHHRAPRRPRAPARPRRRPTPPCALCWLGDGRLVVATLDFGSSSARPATGSPGGRSCLTQRLLDTPPQPPGPPDAGYVLTDMSTFWSWHAEHVAASPGEPGRSASSSPGRPWCGPTSRSPDGSRCRPRNPRPPEPWSARSRASVPHDRRPTDPRRRDAGRRPAGSLVDSPGERRPPDRPERQDLAARGRPRAGRRVPQGDRAVRGARAQPRAHPHLPAHTARALERPRRRPRRRAGRRHPAHLQPLRRPARAARRRRRDDGALRPAAPGEAPVHGLVLVSTDRPVLEEVLRAKRIQGMLGNRIDDDTVVVHASERGNLKQALLKLGWPAEDFAGYVDGEAHAIELDQTGVDAARLPARGGPSRSGTAARAWWCCRAAPARPWSAPPRWPRPRRPR